MWRQFIKQHFFTFAILRVSSPPVLNFGSHQLRLAHKLLFIIACVLGTSAQLFISLPADCKVVRLDQVDLAGKHYDYLYQWSDPQIKAKFIVIAIHGIMMHGLTYDHLANHLAQQGAIVFSPDLPGCGRRWNKDAVSYAKSQEDLTNIIESAKSIYKNLPVICLGESLGANLALSVAHSKQGLVDGIILSSPALKRRVIITPKIVLGSMNLAFGLLKPDTVIDLSPYMRNYASENPLIIKTMFDDPLVHRQIKCQDLWDSCNGMRGVFKEAKSISKTTPVLIMEGSQDKILKADAVIKLVSNLGSENQTVRWFNDRGHVLIEECQPKPDILQTIDDWFRNHIDRSLLEEAKSDEHLPISSSLPALTETALNTNANSN